VIHHDSRDYAEARSAAAKACRPKLEKMIEDGRAKAKPVIESVLARVIDDRIVRAPVLKFRPAANALDWLFDLPDATLHAHRHAFGQVLEDAGVPKAFANKLEEQANGTAWGKELLAHNLNTIFGHRDKQKNLLRAEGDCVKGFLSDRFRRIDSRPLLETFVAGCNRLGLVPIDGVASDTRCRLRAVFPKVFEPIPDEPLVFFLEWGNSDYGHGGHVVNLGVCRIYCTNLAVAEQRLRQVHLGSRLADDIRYSEETYQADTKANTLALADVVEDAISPERLNALCAHVEKAGEKALKGTDVAAILTKALSNKKDVETVLAAYEGHDVVNLPAGHTMWRLSNALSWVAQAPGISADRKIELQEAAGGVFMPKRKSDAVEV
jgi:hypothetical protein